jgi:hypothetical protein
MSGPVLPHGSPHAKDDMSYIKRSQTGGRSSPSNPVREKSVPCYAASERILSGAWAVPERRLSGS